MEDFDLKERKFPEENRKGLVTSRKENRILSYISRWWACKEERCVESKGSRGELEKKRSHMIVPFSSVFSGGKKVTFCSAEEDRTGWVLQGTGEKDCGRRKWKYFTLQMEEWGGRSVGMTGQWIVNCELSVDK